MPRVGRLRPWRSDYLRWRRDVFGREAKTIGAGDFFRFVWQEKGQLIRFCIGPAADDL
jgi:hypothetical protein